MDNTAEVMALEGDDLETWSALATVLEWLPAALDTQLMNDARLTHFEYGIMYALATAEERTLRMSVLAGYANSSLSRLSRAVSRLERKGWVGRSPDPSDGRSTLATLTDEGETVANAATPGHAALVHQLVLDQLTTAQKRQLREICLRVLGGLREDGGWRPQELSASFMSKAAN